MPSESTIKNFLYSINYLRFIYSDSFPVLVENRFEIPLQAGEILVGFDDSTAVLVNNHQYSGWSLLDSALLPDSILEYPDRLGIARFGFDEQYNPLRLSTHYKNLPGVEFSEPNYSFYFNGSHPIFPGLKDGELSYVFVENCAYLPNIYYYFKYIDGEPIFVGINNIFSQEDHDGWKEAKNNTDQFYEWLGLGP